MGTNIAGNGAGTSSAGNVAANSAGNPGSNVAGNVASGGASGGASGAAGAPVATANRPSARAVAAGACLGARLLNVPVTQCTRLDEAVSCGQQKCNLDACFARCPEYLSCLDAAADPCDGSCAVPAGCQECLAQAMGCVFIQQCSGIVQCATATPNGPCAKIKACCEMQTEGKERCLQLAEMITNLSGDPSCIGLMSDWDFINNIAAHPKCQF